MKKTISLLLALILTLALAVPAGAVEPEDDALGIIGGADGPTYIFISDAATDTAEEEEQLAAQREQTITLLGGTAGQINVLLGERCIAFTDAAPALRDGRTMVPMRAALEAMGAVVEYDPATRTAHVTGEKASFTHVIGTDLITLSDGTTEKMDVVSYLTETNRTMVPVRFFSQVLGYEVFWDNDYKMVFLLDKQSMIDAVDAQCTVLNGYLAKSSAKLDAEKNYREEMKLSGAVKVIDSINGDRSYDYSAAASALLGREGMTLSLKAELGELVTLLEGLAGQELPAEYRALVSSFALEAIYGEKLYMKSPLLDAVMDEEDRTGAWYAMSGVDFAALYEELLGGDYTVGKLCYAVMAQGDENHFFDSWSAAGTLADAMVKLFGDGTFTKSGSSCKWHLGLEELAALMNEDKGVEGIYTAEDFREAGIEALAIDMTLRADGSMELKLVLEIYQGQQSALRLELAASGDNAKSAVKGMLQVRNVCDVSFDGSVTVRTTNEKISAVPPEGALIVPVN